MKNKSNLSHPSAGAINKSKGGRPVFEPTQDERQLVEALSGYGLRHCDICHLVRDGISEPTLAKHFATELARGRAKAFSHVGKSLFQLAKEGNIQAAIWFSKTQMGWRETQGLDVSSSDGSMSPPTTIIFRAPNGKDDLTPA